MEALKPRTDHKLKMDILIDSVKTQFRNFTDIAILTDADREGLKVAKANHDKMVAEMEAVLSKIK